ncbi:MAG TPA: RodZ domain-containing protein [Terriglobales bacterium]|nr:RodZ domain-containing protein [Terriglobales bacterium]
MTPEPAGSTWKKRRESMGKTIGEVSAELRVGHRYLEGIEEGNFGDFPERVFSIGFIRSYSKYLSQDPEPVLADYERSIGSRADSETAAQLRFGWVERERERGSRRATYSVAAGAVLLVGVILAWVTLRTERSPLPPPPPPTVVALPSPPAVENAAKTGDNAAATVLSGVDNMTAPVLPSTQAAPTLAESPSSVAAVGGTGPLAGPFQLFLEASEQAWVMYSFDDGDPIDVTLYAGDKISIQAKRRITLKFGNAGGVAGTLNGRRLPPFGERGQVRKFTFGDQ